MQRRPPASADPSATAFWPLEPNDLLLFARVAERGSFTAAAESLGLPKSTLSRRLSALEARLGERLMQRSTRRLQLTDFGQAVLEHAQQVAADTEAAWHLAQQRAERPSGRLRVSMPADFAELVLADTLADYARRCPEVALELDLSPRRVDLLAENYDLALRMGELGDDGVLNARKLAEFRSELFAAPGWWQRQGAPEHPGALLAGVAGVAADAPGTGRLAGGPQHMRAAATLGAGERAAAGGAGSPSPVACALMLGTPGRPLRPWSLARTADDGGQEVWQGLPARRLVANAPSLLLALARAGEGVALVPRVMAQPHLDSGALVPVLPGWATAPSAAWAVFPGRRLMPAKTRVLIDMLAAALAACAGH